MSQASLMAYLNKVKAQSKYTLYKGRRVKSYQVPGTEGFKDVFKARANLAMLLDNKE